MPHYGKIGCQSELLNSAAIAIGTREADLSLMQLVTSAIQKTDPNEANQFASPLSWIIIILLVVSAVLQIYCLVGTLCSIPH